MKYSIVIEKTTNNYSAYSPDVPGCVATGKSINEVKDNMLQALIFHIHGLKEDGLPVPVPESQVDYLSVSV
ncbi:MAG: type II toxin-antitoxin system HicB family antitoxin [Syntrophomonas sp.]|nr:type II toxin-antitoxin system HicB family antitoxin [Syntrophomonas sp.]